MANISYYGSHNAALVVEEGGEILIVIEVERFNIYKNSGISQYKVPVQPFKTLQDILDFIKKHYGIEEYDNCISMNTDVIWDSVHMYTEQMIPAKNYIKNSWHHVSHAANGFYQSPYQKAIAFSFDGGGNDGFFNIYMCDREEGITHLERIEKDYGFPYMVFGHFMKDIKYENLGDGCLIYPGKIMGLVSYGKVRHEWYEPIKEFYNKKPDGNNYREFLATLSEQTGIIFDDNDRLEGEVAYDLATTSQRVFEDCFLDYALPYFEEYPNLPIIIAGGCGLNILLNTRLKQEFNKDVFVGPSPNDCGLAAGMMLNFLKPQEPVVLTYSGLPILDEDTLTHYYHQRHEDLEIEKLAKYIQDGMIVGCVRGRSEHGPRALGNRSILCDPSYPEMKDILNSKVKHREWYRPFAPLVRLEDVSKYFHFEGESTWMSFAPVVREEWREKLSAITHIDNTARVQTVTREQNEFIYDLLTEMDKNNGVGVLLNTSFNVNGQPILTTIKDAFKVYENSQMDMLIIKDILFKKN